MACSHRAAKKTPKLTGPPSEMNLLHTTPRRAGSMRPVINPKNASSDQTKISALNTERQQLSNRLLHKLVDRQTLSFTQEKRRRTRRREALANNMSNISDGRRLLDVSITGVPASRSHLIYGARLFLASRLASRIIGSWLRRTWMNELTFRGDYIIARSGHLH